MTITEMVGAQNQIINLQSEIIDGLYLALAQHLSEDDILPMPEIGKMGVAAGMRAKLEGEV